MSATEALLAFAGGDVALPEAARTHLAMLLADTLAVGIAGSGAPGADGVLGTSSRMGKGIDAPILGRWERLPAPGAAFTNAFQIHCLEWDAVHEGAVVHAMSVVTAAVHAVAHRERRRPEETFAALAIGVEVACRLGLATDGPMRIFRPAHAGLYGAALACGRLMRLRRLDDVLGLAHAQAAGTMQAHVEGSIALPVQIAHAARAAVTAADLAAEGLTGPHDALEGPFGHFALFETGDPARMALDLGGVWHLAGISVKPWPSGRASHAVLAVLEGWKSADVRSVEAEVPMLVHRLVGRPWVTDMAPAYARLCLPFLAALMLTEGRIDPRRFTADSFADVDLRKIGARVTVRQDANHDPNALSPQRVLVNGAPHDVPATLGSPEAPLSPERHRAKLEFALSLSAARNAPAAAELLSRPIAHLAGRDS
jgi:2-methylcitrate dehydratase PrpD